MEQWKAQLKRLLATKNRIEFVKIYAYEQMCLWINTYRDLPGAA